MKEHDSGHQNIPGPKHRNDVFITGDDQILLKDRTIPRKYIYIFPVSESQIHGALCKDNVQPVSISFTPWLIYESEYDKDNG